MSSTNPLAQLSIVLDLGTIESSPSFFALYALTLRSAGATVLVVGDRADAAQRAAECGVPFNDASFFTGAGKDKDSFHHAKYAMVMELLKVHHVIWVDLDFAHWHGPPVDNIPKLTILNWDKVKSMVVRGGLAVEPARS